MKGAVIQPKKFPVVDKLTQEEGSSLFKRPLDLISPYEKDPFLAHLTTPITSSRATNFYLRNLPAYKEGVSPLLRGMHIGFAHSYFIFGPFAKLGPLRATEAANFIGFVSTISIIILLTAGLLIYGYVTFKKQRNQKDPHLNFINNVGWYQMVSGFILGGFGGAGVAYTIANLVTSNVIVP